MSLIIRRFVLISFLVVACDETSPSAAAPDAGPDFSVLPQEDVVEEVKDIATEPEVTVDAEISPVNDILPDIAETEVLPNDADINGADLATAEEYGGGIALSEIDTSVFNLASAGARFIKGETPLPVGQEFGPCVAHFQDPNEQGPPEEGYNAGLISISGTTPSLSLTPVSEPNGTGYESSLSDDHEELLPLPPASLSVSAAGGEDIGGFTTLVQVPDAVIVTSPNLSGLGATHNSDQDLAVTWTGATADQAVVTLSPLDSSFQGKPGTMLTCILATDDGEFIVPSGALAALAPNDSFALGVTRLRVKKVTNSSGQTVSISLVRSSGGALSLN